MAARADEIARSLVGIPFRPQGRDPATGVDCAGLAILCFHLPATVGRTDYRLRGKHGDELVTVAKRHFRRVSRNKARPGDLLMFRVADDQFHLGVKTERGLIHADAGLRAVIERPGEAPWALVGIFRRRVRQVKAG